MPTAAKEDIERDFQAGLSKTLISESSTAAQNQVIRHTSQSEGTFTKKRRQTNGCLRPLNATAQAGHSVDIGRDRLHEI